MIYVASGIYSENLALKPRIAVVGMSGTSNKELGCQVSGTVTLDLSAYLYCYTTERCKRLLTPLRPRNNLK